MKGGFYEFRAKAAVIGRGPDRDDHAVCGERPATIRGAQRHPASHGPGGWLGQHHRPRWCAVRHRRRSRQDLARRSADRGDHDVRQRSAEGAIPGYPFGGAIDVAFIGKTAYVLVTLVGPDVGGSDVVGIYRVDGPDSFTVVADIGAFSMDNPPTTAFFVPTGVQYALETYRGGFLVTDGHHNRVLRVTLDGEITELIAFDNIVPTGLAVSGNTVYMAEAGPVPHLPENGKVVAFGPKSPTATEVASGASLLVDVEFGRGHTSLRALAGRLFGRP